jgi:hypothetical protein
MAVTTNDHKEQVPLPEKDLADVEEAETSDNGMPPGQRHVSPQEIQARYPLLRDLSPDQMAALNKRVVRKIDWRLMPMITIMFLLK